MTSRGRPAIGERVELRIPADMLARIDARAERDGISRAEAIRRALQETYGA